MISRQRSRQRQHAYRAKNKNRGQSAQSVIGDVTTIMMEEASQILGEPTGLEREAESLYLTFLEKTEALVGSRTTFASDLLKAGKLLFGRKFMGVFASDKQPTLTKTTPYAILNLDKTNEPGSHWIAVAWTSQGTMVYDSFGRHTDEIIKIKGVSMDTDHDPEQDIVETNCGARSLAWLMIFDKLGPKVAALI
jgi:hypothetical protein